MFANKLYSPLVVANAVIVNNLATKLVANFFFNFDKPHFPYQVFTSEERTISWLMEKIKSKGQAEILS